MSPSDSLLALGHIWIYRLQCHTLGNITCTMSGVCFETNRRHLLQPCRPAFTLHHDTFTESYSHHNPLLTRAVVTVQSLFSAHVFKELLPAACCLSLRSALNRKSLVQELQSPQSASPQLQLDKILLCLLCRTKANLPFL